MPTLTTLAEWDSASIINAVKADGIVVLDQFFDEKKLSALNAEFSRLFDMSVDGVKTHHKSDYLDAKHIDPQKLNKTKFPVLTRLADDPLLRKTAEGYFQKPIIYPHKIFATLSTGTGEPVQKLPFVAHTDRFQMFKYMIYLHDVTAENGAMAVAPGKQKEMALKRLEWIRSGKAYTARPNIIPEYDSHLIPVEARGGSVLVFDTDVPHKAGRTIPGEQRRALRIDIVCPSYAGTNGKRNLLDLLFRRKAVAD